MNHSMIVKKSLRYLNRVFAVLMVVVVSLNIEQIFHNKRIQNFEHIRNQNQNLDEKIKRCEICQNEGLSALNRLNITGALLSLVLAVFSLIFAHRSDLFKSHYNWFVPSCLTSTILTAVYFIIVITTHIDKECINGKNFDPLWHCDAEFNYSMENKIKPLSILMLVCIPQFVARSCSLLTEKYAKKDSKNGVCKNWYSVEMKEKTTNHNLISKHHYENVHVRSENEIGLLQDSPIEYGFRELPVDCPYEAKLSNQTLPRIEFYDEENDVYLEKNRQGFNDNEFFGNEDFDQVILDNKLPNFKMVNQKRIFMRNSSLSTISEEKTFATMTEISNQYEKESPKVNPSKLVCSVIDEFHDKTVIMNKIIHVFQPSSKDGCFSRNVPIRLTSPRKSTVGFSSPLSLRSSNSCSPSSNDFDLSPNFENSILISNLVMAKKIRFVKRLKNRIETKSGKKLLNKNWDLKLRMSPVLSIGKKSQIKKRKFLSFNSMSKDTRDDTFSFGQINRGANISPEKIKSKINSESDLVVPKMDVEPVFF